MTVPSDLSIEELLKLSTPKHVEAGQTWPALQQSLLQHLLAGRDIATAVRIVANEAASFSLEQIAMNPSMATGVRRPRPAPQAEVSGNEAARGVMRDGGGTDFDKQPRAAVGGRLMMSVAGAGAEENQQQHHGMMSPGSGRNPSGYGADQMNFSNSFGYHRGPVAGSKVRS